MACAVLAVAAVVAGCSNNDDEPAASESTIATGDGHNGDHTFTYEGAEGPDKWGPLSPEWAACADGTAQSPIDVVDPTPQDLANPVIDFTSGEATVINNGHTIEAEQHSGGSVTIDGVEYPFVQMHFHSPSEHTIAGEHAPAEAHFVSKTTDGKIAVVAVMLQEGASANAAWEPFISAADVAVGEEVESEIEWPELLPESSVSIRYSGSLTTPPCTEAVSWIVMQEPVSLSADQLDALRAAYDGNSRPVQPLNDRAVLVDSTP